MSTISVSLPSDGTTADVSDINTPITTIVNAINGGLDNSNIASGAAIAGSKLADGAITNAKLSTTAGDVGGVWTSWTPTLTNLSGGTLNYAKYTQIGKTVHFRLKYTLAGAGVAGNISFTVPANLAADYSDAGITPITGRVVFRDTGTRTYTGELFYASSSTLNVALPVITGGNIVYQIGVDATTPFTWANTDIFFATGTYEAA